MSAILKALKNRNVRYSYIPRGGDLFVAPVDLDQQKALLDLDTTTIANRSIRCSLPNSVSGLFKGIISYVPINDSEEEMLSALKRARS